MVLLLRESFWDAACLQGFLPEGLLISFFYSFSWGLLWKTMSEGHCFDQQGVFPGTRMKGSPNQARGNFCLWLIDPAVLQLHRVPSKTTPLLPMSGGTQIRWTIRYQYTYKKTKNPPLQRLFPIDCYRRCTKNFGLQKKQHNNLKKAA